MNLVDLRNYIKTQKGYAFKSKWFIKAGIPIVKVKDFTDDSISKENVDYINDELACDFDRYLIDTNDVIIQTVGSWASNPNSVVGKAVKVPSALKGALLNQNAVKIIPTEKLDKKFLYYTLRTDDFKGYIVNTAQGSASQASITLESIKNYNFHLPLLHTQKRIADILSAYDDLIENNLKRIKLLEQAGQNIYKEWFVHLRFPNYENTPINEETGLPVGWKEKVLGDIISKLESGSRPKGGIDKSLKTGVPSIGAESVRGLGYFDFSKTKYIKKYFFEKMRKGILEDRDILIYKDGAYIGRSTLFQDNFPFEKCSINEHIFLIHAKEEKLQYYLYLTLHSNLYFEKMQSLNSNAAQPGINQKKIKTLPIVIPSSDLLVKFDSIVKPMIKQIYKLAKMNLELKTGRDILLPRLMNRTIEV